MKYALAYQEVINDHIDLLEKLKKKDISLPEFRVQLNNLKDKEAELVKIPIEDEIDKNTPEEHICHLFSKLLYKDPNEEEFILAYKCLKKYLVTFSSRSIPIIDRKASFFQEYESKPGFEEKEQNKEYLLEWLKNNQDLLTIFDFSALGTFYPNNVDIFKTGQELYVNKDVAEMIKIYEKIIEQASSNIIHADLFLVMLYRVYNFFYDHQLPISYADVLLANKYNEATNALFKAKKTMLINSVSKDTPSVLIYCSKDIKNEEGRNICLMLCNLYSFFTSMIFNMNFKHVKSEMFHGRTIRFDSYKEFVRYIKGLWFLELEPINPFISLEFPNEDENLLDRFEMVEIV